jgi:hypothetical protein
MAVDMSACVRERGATGHDGEEKLTVEAGGCKLHSVIRFHRITLLRWCTYGPLLTLAFVLSSERTYPSNQNNMALALALSMLPTMRWHYMFCCCLPSIQSSLPLRYCLDQRLASRVSPARLVARLPVVLCLQDQQGPPTTRRPTQAYLPLRRYP